MTGSVNQTYASGLDQIVSYITGRLVFIYLPTPVGQLGNEKIWLTYLNRGAYAVIDPHNFGRYYNNIITDVSGFGAWWTTMAKRYASNSRVIFDTNNEFHDEDNTLVANLNQKAIDSIRAAGATSQYIFVEGNSWTGAWHWVSTKHTSFNSLI
jgi:endoglucanase